MGRLTGRCALVTGASRGIGRAISLALASEGASVALNYRSGAEECKAVAGECAALGAKTLLLQGNVSERATWTRMIDAITDAWGRLERATWTRMIDAITDAWGRLDVLVNNAGITRDRTLRKMTDEDWLDVISTNLNACYYGVSSVASLMTAQNYGRIINISSFTGQAGNFGQANYSASKGGIIAFTKTAAIELAKHNITVNSLAPGFTLTEMLAKVPEAVQTQIKSKIPMGRFGQPDEIAKAVVFLAADADYVTGQQINVNGGIYM